MCVQAMEKASFMSAQVCNKQVSLLISSERHALNSVGYRDHLDSLLRTISRCTDTVFYTKALRGLIKGTKEELARDAKMDKPKNSLRRQTGMCRFLFFKVLFKASN